MPVPQHEDPSILATMSDIRVMHRLLSRHYEICNVRLRAERLAHHHGYMQELPNGAGYEVVVDPRSGFWKTQETLIHEWAHVLHHVYGPNDWLSVEDSPHIGSSPCSLNHNSTWGRYYADVYRTATCE